MIAAAVPMWILGGAFVALLVLNAIFNGGTSAMSDRPGVLNPSSPNRADLR